VLGVCLLYRERKEGKEKEGKESIVVRIGIRVKLGALAI
jgi:hypothetical protein